MASVSGPIELTEPELKLLQSLIYQECGMYFDERRTHFLHDRLQRRMRACGLDTFYSYYRLLTSRDGKAEFKELLEHLTVNETSFFRNRPQLDLFQKVILEKALQHKQARRDWTLAPVERRMFHRPRAVYAGNADLRRAGLLLFAQSAAV